MLLICPFCRAECTVDDLSADTVTCPTCGQQLSTRTGTPLQQVILGDTPAAKDETREWRETDLGTAVDIDVLPVRLGRYFVESLIAQGGFAKVYLATDEELGRQVALKIPRLGKFKTPAKLREFLAEARIAAKLRHPGIITIFDVGQFANGLHYIAMEYVAGQPLSDLMSAGRIPVSHAVDLLIKIAEAVHYAHGQGLVHRDLKPGNILLDERGEPRVVDFGLAVHETSQAKLQGEVAGTPAFMSPEQFRGEVHRLDGRTDIWSLGCVFYQLLTGRRPFNGDVHQLYDEVLNKAPKPPRQIDDQIPRELEVICFKCLSKSVNDRYTTAKDVAEALGDWQHDNTLAPPFSASTPAGTQVVELQRDKRSSVRVALALALMITGALAAVQLLPTRKAKEETIIPAPLVPARQGSGDLPDLRKFFRVDDRATRGKWVPLLDRKPNELVWRGDSAFARWVYDKSRDEVVIDSIDVGLLGVGFTESHSFILKTGIAKKGWTGRAGLFWGYQAISHEGNVFYRCQTVSLYCRTEKGGTTYLIDRLMYKCTPLPGSDGLMNIDNCGICKAEEVVKPGVTENELEVEVALGLVKQIRWCGKPLLSLSDNAATLRIVTPAAKGWFGVWNNDGTSVFLNTQFKALSGPIQQEEDL